MATFLIVPVLCVVASRKLVTPIPPAFLMYTAGGLRMLERVINGFLGYS